jgi:hypothetical protein
MTLDRVIIGDCRETLRTIDAGAVQCCVTSPPYWGLRDYGCEGQIGLEQSPAEYVEQLVAVFREVRRVLAEDGTLWLNLGDSYVTNPHGKGSSFDPKSKASPRLVDRANRGSSRPSANGRGEPQADGYHNAQGKRRGPPRATTSGLTNPDRQERVIQHARVFAAEPFHVGGYVWFWHGKPSAKALAKVPEGPEVTTSPAQRADQLVDRLTVAPERTKPVFLVRVWSRASLNAKMKTNPDDPLVKRIEMLLLAREIEVPQDEWANVVAAGEAMLEAEAGQ